MLCGMKSGLVSIVMGPLCWKLEKKNLFLFSKSKKRNDAPKHGEELFSAKKVVCFVGV